VSFSPRIRRVLQAALLSAGIAAAAPAERLVAESDPPAAELPTEAQLDRAIRRGLDYLYKVQRPRGEWVSSHSRRHPGGTTSLALLAALASGEDAARKELTAALTYVGGVQPGTVYARSLRAMVYARLEGEDFARRLAEDTAWLAQTQSAHNGGWGYGPGHPATRQRRTWTDASNSQLAILALRCAAEAGAKVPSIVWKKACAFWTGSQNADGGWGYEPPGGTGFRLQGSSYGSMTAAGVASLLTCVDFWAAGAAAPGRDSLTAASRAVERGLAWLESNYALDRIPKYVWGQNWVYYYYYLHCFSRAADAAGLRTLAGSDWYGQMVRILLSRQRRNGSWGGDPRSVRSEEGEALLQTCFALLAIAEARKPVLLSRMTGPAAGSQSPRDAAQLLRRLSRMQRRGVTWQRVAPDAPQEVLAEASLLYLDLSAKDETSPDTAAQRNANIRRFVLGGGTLLVQAGERAEPVQEALLELFEEYDYRASALPADHGAFQLRHRIPPADRPQVIGIGDHCRTRIFVAVSDLSGAWHRGKYDQRPGAFQFAANLASYATAGADLPGKLAARRPRPAAPQAARFATVARVRHGGDWHTNPLAMEKLSDVLRRAVNLAIREAAPVDLRTGVPSNVTLLWMTGSLPVELAAAQREHLKRYVLDGGTLWVDSAVGKAAFAESVTSILRETFGPGSLLRLAPTSPLITGEFCGGVGSDLRRVRYTPAAAGEADEPEPPVLYAIAIRDRLAVIVSPYGITCAVEGHPTWGASGLCTADARRLAANVVLYAACRQPLPAAADAHKPE
jgi:hypothetical protein